MTLAGVARLANEMVGWPYHHDLDLTGFIDGTENPTLVEATAVALVPPGPRGEGGSILLLQQWEHDAIGMGGPAGRRPGDRHRPAQGRQRGARPEAAGLARRADRPGQLRKDLPAQHRLRIRGPARHDLRRLLRRAADPGRDAREHGRGARRTAGRADGVHARADAAPTTSCLRPTRWRFSAPPGEYPARSPITSPTTGTTFIRGSPETIDRFRIAPARRRSRGGVRPSLPPPLRPSGPRARGDATTPASGRRLV